MKCPECGVEVGADERFCGNCGAPLGAPTFPSPEEAAASSTDETVIAEVPLPLPDEPVEPAAAEEPSEPTVAEEPALMLAAPGPDLPPSPPGGGQKNKTGLIVAIVVVVLILLCCCCAVVVALGIVSSDPELLDELGITMLPWLSAVA